MVFLMNQFDPKTVVMIHFTKRPLKCSYIIYMFLYNVFQFMETCTKLELTFFDENIMYSNKNR